MLRSRAFSLVEVLVLLCVVGLLAAVVLPAVARQRAAVRADECAMHLRTIGQGWHVFAHDFEAAGRGMRTTRWHHGCLTAGRPGSTTSCGATNWWC